MSNQIAAVFILMFFVIFISSVIEEANWLTLPEDVQKPGDGFDAVICLGNSFAHLPDFKGTWEIKKQSHFLNQLISSMTSFTLFFYLVGKIKKPFFGFWITKRIKDKGFIPPETNHNLTLY